MWPKPSQLCPLNSLESKCIKQLINAQLISTSNFQDSKYNQNEKNLLHFQHLHHYLRQAIFDYIIRERISISSRFICELLNEGLSSFDLWTLLETNNYSNNDICDIITCLANNMAQTKEISLGGQTWMYCSQVVNGPFKMLFKNKLPKLNKLKIQQISCEQDLLNIIKSCDNLSKLEISQPSIGENHRKLIEIHDELRKCSSRSKLRELHLPSSLKGIGILLMLDIFNKVESLKCAYFEKLLDCLNGKETDETKDVEIKITEEQKQSVKRTLASLKCLTITHPMSCDTINKLVECCPLLEELGIELQDCMELFPIVNLTRLKRLEIRNSPMMSAKFKSKVEPILEIIGKQLESLSLEQFDFIDLEKCAKLCPNLEMFSAQWFILLSLTHSLISANQKTAKELFSNLRYLRLRPRSQRSIPSAICTLLLSNATKLINVELYCCDDLSDSDVKTICKRNQMKHLRSLILRHGHNITKDALNQLVCQADQLTFIDCGTLSVSKTENDNAAHLNLFHQ